MAYLRAIEVSSEESTEVSGTPRRTSRASAAAATSAAAGSARPATSASAAPRRWPRAPGGSAAPTSPSAQQRLQAASPSPSAAARAARSTRSGARRASGDASASPSRAAAAPATSAAAAGRAPRAGRGPAFLLRVDTLGFLRCLARRLDASLAGRPAERVLLCPNARCLSSPRPLVAILSCYCCLQLSSSTPARKSNPLRFERRERHGEDVLAKRFADLRGKRLSRHQTYCLNSLLLSNILAISYFHDDISI